MKRKIVFLLFLVFFNIFFIKAQKNIPKIQITPAQYQTMGEDYYKNYQFEQAAECFAKSGDSRAERRAAMAAEMLQRVENVQFIDSIVVDKDSILKYFPKNSEIGFVYSDNAALFGYLTGKKDRKFFAQADTIGVKLYQSNHFLNGWSEPTPIFEQANFDKNENYPFVLSDGITIFFASTHNTLGGYDIFMSRSKPSGEYLLPQNIGMPFNSPANDYLMVIDENRNIGCFASDRNLPTGKVAIYTFIYNAEKNILKNLTIDELREAAQITNLRTMNRGQKEKTAEIQDSLIFNKDKNENLNKKFHFVIFDTIIYNNAPDFKNRAALEQFMIFQQKNAELEKIKNALENLRKDYFFASERKKFIIKEKIIFYENLQKSLEKEAKNIENEVRKLEINN